VTAVVPQLLYLLSLSMKARFDIGLVVLNSVVKAGIKSWSDGHYFQNKLDILARDLLIM